ncbi:MAG TPA: methylamine dehydrogenase (amicyanin) small subunit [Gammaproteobacteria bacterium]|jgi:methylamine dehydrogenase light chain|nr:methylamine dehydrogenase (amicyanin) small subunit [Gammaproteobacteria bacterium]HEX2243274.1 methylamine dehydrogenase (amicyanin) small subunit [Gammaproteobacteria bacterium]
MNNNRFDELVESLTRKVAQGTSRRSFLARLGAVVGGAVLLPLLPVDRRSGTANATERYGWDPQDEDGTLCNYWRHCSLDGQPCQCCGGGMLTCPPGTTLSPSSWVASCQNPGDGKSYLIAYRDCCGKSICPRCVCYNTEGKLPIYRTEFSNDIIWCFGAEGSSYHCTVQPIIGVG